MLMHELAERPPQWTVLHDQQVVSASHQVVGDVRRRSVAVLGGFLINEFFDDATVCYYDGGAGAEDEGIDASILFGPFGESVTMEEEILERKSMLLGSKYVRTSGTSPFVESGADFQG